MPLFIPPKSQSIAYHTDGNDYFGFANRGVSSSSAQWTIMKIVYSGSDWQIHYPVADDKATDEPKFIFDNATSYTYRLLGT